MKKLKATIIALIALMSFFITSGQVTNSFPDNGNVGIGTTAPGYSLDLNSANYVLANFQRSGSGGGAAIMIENALGTGSWLYGVGAHNHFGIYKNGESNFGQQLIILDNGNVGIGTISPSHKLDIEGTLRVKGYAAVNGADFRLGQNDGRDIGVKTSQRALVHYMDDRLYVNFNGDFEGGVRYQGPKHIFDGSVGMGTSDPGIYKLAVKGKIRAEEIKVETGWADYVFKEGYDLPTLEEVEKHIKEKGHLINIPSAKEVEENGIELGEMNKLLLEKIEELTLYILKQQDQLKGQDERLRQVENLELELKNQKKEMEELKTMIKNLQK